MKALCRLSLFEIMLSVSLFSKKRFKSGQSMSYLADHVQRVKILINGDWHSFLDQSSPYFKIYMLNKRELSIPPCFKGEVHSENYFFFYWLKLFSSSLRDEQKKPREKILIFGEVMNVRKNC